ncbi:hypothetical protein HHK36_003611 [Tetracentron sinense]|uniref:WRKY domain-containing protein n=1 Tax=Tetracentron sinense TaxID=13715 RepID=A0A834ZRF9_TETSI|nr:hypothetical protein HHK36_003611 [Tetracentron sinense]
MDGRFNNHPFVNEQEDHENITETAGDSPVSGLSNDGRMITAPSSKKSRRAVQKRVVSVPIGDVDGSRHKGEGAPPSDSWAWRKYGQKPIKGSPYPRGYYRCSSSKGCPARKQVERSRVDPTVLVITYAYEHNHPWPASRNHNTTTTIPSKFSPEESTVFSNKPEIKPDEKFSDLGEELMLTSDDYSWFSDVASTSPTVLQSPLCVRSSCGDPDVAMIFPMREEDESLFADLGELPECSVVFRRGVFEQEEERRRCSLSTAPWCGSTG